MHKYLLRIAAAIISICFGVYLAKGNLDWIPNWMLLVVALSAGIYWLSFEPNVREACADLWRREPSRLVYSSDYEADFGTLIWPHFGRLIWPHLIYSDRQETQGGTV